MSLTVTPWVAPEVRDDTSRREFVAGGLSLGALALLGCGSDADEPAGRREAASGFPVTLEHKFGRTRVDAPPRRVVTVGYVEQDHLLALGVVPVGVRAWVIGDAPAATGPWAQRAVGGETPKVLPNAELAFEAIAALRPDLIVGTYSGMTDADYTKLSRIAPTLAQSAEFIDFGMPWEHQQRVIGRALGRAERADEIVAGIRERVSEVRARHREFAGRSVVLAGGTPGKAFGVFASQDPRGRLLEQLGLRIPPRIDEITGKEYWAEVSRELASELEADLLVFLGPPRSERAAMLADPIYRRLNVVREGRVVYLDQRSTLEAALNFNSPLSLPYAIDGLEPRIAAALDGDAEPG